MHHGRPTLKFMKNILDVKQHYGVRVVVIIDRYC